MTWMPSANVDAQTAHFAISWAVVAQTKDWKWRWLWTILLVVILAAGKEFIFDLLVEKDSMTGSIMDYGFYILGLIVAIWVNRDRAPLPMD